VYLFFYTQRRNKLRIRSLNRDSELIPRSLLRGWRANQKIDRIPLGEDALQLAAGYASIVDFKVTE
jgi:hypothetical protein